MFVQIVKMSGKWNAKETAAKKYAEENNLEYRLIMKSDVINLKNDIIRYFWLK